MKKIYCAFIFCLLFSCGCCNAGFKQGTKLAAAVNITNTIREMKTAGFWIEKQENPDQIILEAKGREEFNVKTEKELNLIINPLNETYQHNGKTVKKDLQKEIENFSRQKLYTVYGKQADANFYRPIEQNMNLSALKDKIDARYGFLMHYDNQRLLPADSLLTEEALDVEFDELQNSSLDLGTPLIVLHESSDGRWVYAHAPTSSGWFKKERIAFCQLSEFKDLLSRDNFIVVTSAKADIFLDKNLSRYYDYVRMGAKFALNETTDAGQEIFEIIIPCLGQDGKFFAQKAYIKKQDANKGYLTYTPRNILEQAFKLLNSPYGWGGMGGEQDCSSFIQEVFAAVGITLPRNSSAQAKTGTLLGSFKGGDETEEKIKIIRQKAIPGATILQMKGHVVLYIGMYNNTAYIIHETHGYGQGRGSQAVTRVINRVIVSDLSLGEGSKKGSLLSRIVNIRVIK